MGANVGALGLKVGSSVGTKVGFRVGLNVGLYVGTRVPSSTKILTIKNKLMIYTSPVKSTTHLNYVVL